MAFERQREVATPAHKAPRDAVPARASTTGQTPPRAPIGQLLVAMGALSPGDLVRATAMRAREDARIGDILLAHGMVDETTLYRALAQQYGAQVAELERRPPDVRLIDQLGADVCLRRGLLPWRQTGGATVIASCRPEEFDAIRAEMEALFGPVRLAVTSEKRLHDTLLRARHRQIAASAETRVAAHESVRAMDMRRITKGLILGLAALALWAVFQPSLALLALAVWAAATLAVTTLLKLSALIAQSRHRAPDRDAFATRRGPAPRLPTVSIMVPLYKEREIAGRLVKRLSRLVYPRELLDICLVVEEDDQITQAAVAAAKLPRWIRQIVVPRGGVKTKPRALNIALDFCRGSLIGIYDAEDAPEPDQIHKVAAQFAQAAPDVACLQGNLDFYNARTNWLSRCFTVEYASWFRVILRGYARMGLVVPLGGTTLFFRREAIEKLGGWDAHNVTEDADLGIRLARHGYRTELIDTVTEEEANCRALPWVKQRSRWLKGYAMTWAVHTRHPRALWRDLGPWKFFGVQALFLGTLSQVLLAPLLWSFWAFPLGLPHPLRPLLPDAAFYGLATLFILSEVVTIATGLIATSGPKHKWLWAWVPSLHFYYPLASFGALKALWELLTDPFYWDKTPHGVHDAGFHEGAGPSDPPLKLTAAQRLDGARPSAPAPTPVAGFAEAAQAFDARRAPRGPARRLTFGMTLPPLVRDPVLAREITRTSAEVPVTFKTTRLRPAPPPEQVLEVVETRFGVAVIPQRPVPRPTPRAEAGPAGWTRTAAFAPHFTFVPCGAADRMADDAPDPA